MNVTAVFVIEMIPAYSYFKIFLKEKNKNGWHHFRQSDYNFTIMPVKLIVLIIVSIFCFANADAQTYRHQAGVRLGSIDQVVSSGLSYRYHFNNNKAVEALVNLRDPVSIGAMYEIFNPIKAVDNLQWFYGAGAYASFKGFDNFGIMGIAGIDYQFPEVPVNLSIDWKPELNIIEGVSFRAATVGVSVRFSFGKQ
jgi:hypothetical protein